MPPAGPPWANFHSAQEILIKFYGGSFVTLPHESDYTLGTTPVAIDSKRNLARVGLLLSNTGATNIAISFKDTVAIATGVLLLPGGTFSLDWYYDGDLVERLLYGVSSGAGGTLHMLERFLIGA